MWRGSRVWFNTNEIVILENLERYQNFQEPKLRQKEKVDLTCGQGGVLKMAGRTGVVCIQAFLGVEVIDEQSRQEEEDKKGEVKIRLRCSFHVPAAVYYTKNIER